MVEGVCAYNLYALRNYKFTVRVAAIKDNLVCYNRSGLCFVPGVSRERISSTYLALTMLLGIVISVRLVQLMKAIGPIAVTPSGITMLLRFVQSEKAASPM